jgi:hypothetical protein
VINDQFHKEDSKTSRKNGDVSHSHSRSTMGGSCGQKTCNTREGNDSTRRRPVNCKGRGYVGYLGLDVNVIPSVPSRNRI